MSTTLVERLQEILPNAAPHWTGRPNYNEADIEWQDGYIIVTSDDDGYLIGVYTTEGWTELGEPSGSVIVPDADAVVTMVDYLTEYQPEGTDWSAWAAQRLDDDGPDAAG